VHHVVLANGVLLAGAVMLAGTAAAEAKRPTCSERGGSTVVRSPSVRVFKKGDDVYGCHRGPRKVFRLGTDFSPETAGAEVGVRPVRVVGPLVGYSYFIRGRGASRQSLRVRDLRDGRTLRLIDYSDPEAATVSRRVTDLELSSTGSLAWIVAYVSSTRAGTSTTRYEVRRAKGPLGRTPQRADELIDPGPDIAPQSLTVRDGTLSWMRSGQVVSAPLRSGGRP